MEYTVDKFGIVTVKSIYGFDEMLVDENAYIKISEYELETTLEQT